MRTTLTLDDDVAVQLERMRVEKRITLKEAVNSVLRRGLANPESLQSRAKPFKTRSVSVGRLKIQNLDNIGEVLAQLEGEDYK